MSNQSFWNYFVSYFYSLFNFNFQVIINKVLKFLRILKVFSREWLFTTNHKRLGLNYVFFAVFSGLFGASLSTLIRLELSNPGSVVFANNANMYHTVMGVHAFIMVFFLVTPLVFGGFGNYFFPIHIGARDVAYPRLNNFSLWLLPAGFIVMLRTLWEGVRISNLEIKSDPVYNNLEYSLDSVKGLVLEVYNNDGYSSFNEVKNTPNEVYNFSHLTSGSKLSNSYSGDLEAYLPFISSNGTLTSTLAGWTFTTPFSHSRFTGAPVDWALAGLLIASLSTILTLINLIVTWRYLRGRGSRFQRELFPIVLLAIFISIRLLIIVTPILNAGLIMLIADRHFATAFFTVRAGGDFLLFQHIFWFFGHPEVYILMMPAFGIASTLIPYYVRKPIGSKMHMIYAMHAIASMGMVVWGHHMYLVGLDNKARTLFFVVTVMIGLPASVKLCGWIASLVNGTTYLTIELMYTIVYISFFLIGGFTGILCAHVGTDIMLHDTYYIVGHFHIMLSGALMIMIIGYIYFNFREFFGVYYSWSYAFLQLLTHTIGHILTFFPMLWLGYAGMPRRIQDYPWGFVGWNSVASLGHTIVLLSIVFFLITITNALYIKRSSDSKNKGFPFLSVRLSYLLVDRYYAKMAIIKKQTNSLVFMRYYYLNLNNNTYF
jgi:heme/copper-type cytochrome/quinol oxidase subunit 1